MNVRFTNARAMTIGTFAATAARADSLYHPGINDVTVHPHAMLVYAATGRDPHERHALIPPGPFLDSAGSEDRPRRWTALTHTLDVNRVLGYENRVAISNQSEHGPNQESNESVYAFFQRFLKL